MENSRNDKGRILRRLYLDLGIGEHSQGASIGLLNFPLFRKPQRVMTYRIKFAISFEFFSAYQAWGHAVRAVSL